jgi:hypothetical protein
MSGTAPQLTLGKTGLTLTVNDVQVSSNLGFTTATAVIGGWQCWTGENYTGVCHTVAAESSIENSHTLQPDDTTTVTEYQSVRVAPEIILYDSNDVALKLYASAQSLVGNPHNFNDNATSVKVVRGTWKLWTNVDFSGNNNTPQEYTAPVSKTTLPSPFNESVSSVQLVTY